LRQFIEEIITKKIEDIQEKIAGKFEEQKEGQRELMLESKSIEEN
jgi:hypothetical protein